MSKPRRPPSRDIHGIVLLDKPAGLSSNQALQRVRHLFRAAKAGHTGSLDPLATGLLPLCLGEATKIAGLLLGAGKAYRTVARLGITTDTDDADGTVLQQRDVPHLERDAVNAALKPFVGRIQQRPPIYSALKRGGEALYRKARRGEQVDVPERAVEIVRIDVIAQDAERIELEIECGSGTYVRSIVRDLGEALGCGAHVEQLRRLWVDPFRAPRMFTLEQLQLLAAQGDADLDGCMLPIADGLAAYPAIELPPEQGLRLAHGQSVTTAVAPGLYVATLRNGRLLGLVDAEHGELRTRRLFSWALQASSDTI